MTAVAAPRAGSTTKPVNRARWITGPVTDTLVALCWVPFSLAALLWHGRTELLSSLLGATFLLSLAHQPLTLALVYGDPGQFRLKRKLFTWSPLIFVAAIIVGTQMSLVLVAAVAGIWNAEHTLLQRYGLTRIYGRKVGQDDGRIEKLMLQSWLLFSVSWAAAQPGLAQRIDGLHIGGTNERGIRLLTSARPVANVTMLLAGTAAVGLMGLWVRQEWRQRPTVNPAKYLYLGATLALFGVVLIDPLAGLIGYVGAHALEYLVTVHRHVGSRYVGEGSDDGGAVGRTVRSPIGRTGFVLGYLAVTVLLFLFLRSHVSAYAYSVVFLTAGGLHVFYDGFIWKLRRANVARGFAIVEPGTASVGTG